MSQVMSTIKQFASKFNHNKRKHKPGESTSSRPGWMVRDSHLTIGGLRMTNTTAGTFTGLILSFAIGIALVAPAYATSSSITINITNAGNLTINVPPSAEGTFAAGDAATVNVSTTHAAGYNLTVKANSSTDLVGTGSNTNVISSLPTGTSIDANTFSNKDNTQYNNKWGYKPQKYNSTTNSTYRPSPSTSGDTIDSTNNSNNNSYTVSIGARVTNATPIDSYSNTFVFAVVGNPTPYTITYDKNTTDTVTNMPTPNPYTDSSSGEIVANAISATVPARDGYNFKGWCSTTTSDATCSGTTYNPDGDGTSRDLTLNQQSATNSFTLYAMWESARCDDTLYNCIAIAWANEGSRVMTNDTDTSTGIQAAITTANSGVFKYNPSTFGTASDASNTKDIYFYRGILDTTTGSYGSNGDNAAHPNTVLLDANSNGADTTDTCWRIVRTTGSGGVKMIYQGKWTGSTCANAQAAAHVTSSAYNGTDYTHRQIVRVGYTYNSTYATNTSKSGTIAQVFGTNSTASVNNTRSDIKTYIEDTWYAANMTKYTSILEPSAGYCNDRTMNTTTSWTTPLAESTTIASTYGTSGLQAYYFGAYPRNLSTAQPPSLTCGNKYSAINRSTVDLYRYNGTNGAAGSTTANYLKYPAALLTADEVSFAGSGRSTASQGSAYNTNSYLSSGFPFWLLSPYVRFATGFANGFLLGMNGYLDYTSVNNLYGVRPSISLTSGTTAASGSGTATDPWVVTPPPPTMQDFAAGTAGTTCSSMSVGDTITLSDSRDGEEYLIGKLADNKCWMLDNLRLDPANSTTLNNITASNTHASATSITRFKNGGGTTSDKYPTAKVNNVAWTSSSQNYYSIPMTVSSGNGWTKDTVASVKYGAGSGKIGVYYNYCAASAGSYCYGNGTSAGTSSGNTTEDLCPSGWRMPGGGSTINLTANPPTGEFQNLYNYYNTTQTATDTNSLQYNLSLPLSGFFNSGSVYDQGSLGYSWSSTRSSNSSMYSLSVTASRVYPAFGGFRYYGFSLRCIAQ